MKRRDFIKKIASTASSVAVLAAFPVVVAYAGPPQRKPITFRRAVPYEYDTTSLLEGATPARGGLRYEDVEVSIANYGATYS